MPLRPARTVVEWTACDDEPARPVSTTATPVHPAVLGGLWLAAEGASLSAGSAESFAVPIADFRNLRAGATLAVGETVILLHPPLPSVGASIAMERERQQNDSLPNG